MKYPTVFHLGLPKTGTTTLQEVLKQDKRIHLIQNRYFNTSEYWQHGFDYEKEGTLVTVLSEENLILQSGNFGKLELTLSRIRKCAPEANIVLTIREQRDMLESRYKYCIPYYEGHYFEFDEWLHSGQGMDYLSISMYHTIYTTLLAFFPKEQIHFLFFEDIKHDPEAFYQNFYRLLGLSLPENLDFKKHLNISIPETELRIIKRLNRYKIFRKESLMAKYEERIFEKIAKTFCSSKSRVEEFRWGTSNFHKNIEMDFAAENIQMCKANIVTEEKMKKYGYLLS